MKGIAWVLCAPLIGGIDAVCCHLSVYLYYSLVA